MTQSRCEGHAGQCVTCCCFTGSLVINVFGFLATLKSRSLHVARNPVSKCQRCVLEPGQAYWNKGDNGKSQVICLIIFIVKVTAAHESLVDSHADPSSISEESNLGGHRQGWSLGLSVTALMDSNMSGTPSPPAQSTACERKGCHLAGLGLRPWHRPAPRAPGARRASCAALRVLKFKRGKPRGAAPVETSRPGRVGRGCAHCPRRSASGVLHSRDAAEAAGVCGGR